MLWLKIAVRIVLVASQLYKSNLAGETDDGLVLKWSG